MLEMETRFGTAQQLKTRGILPERLDFYPGSEQYPFDATCTDIVMELQRLGWKAEGFEVTFWMVEGKPVAVSAIEGANFRISFGRGYTRLPNRKEGALVNVGTIDLPKRQLHVYDDLSGPTYRVYTGINWEKDVAVFRDNEGNSNIHGFTYSGSDSLEEYVRTPGRLPRYLTPDRYANRGRRRLPWLKKHFSTEQVLNETNSWLQINVLAPLTKRAL